MRRCWPGEGTSITRAQDAQCASAARSRRSTTMATEDQVCGYGILLSVPKVSWTKLCVVRYGFVSDNRGTQFGQVCPRAQSIADVGRNGHVGLSAQGYDCFCGSNIWRDSTPACTLMAYFVSRQRLLDLVGVCARTSCCSMLSLHQVSCSGVAVEVQYVPAEGAQQGL